ncbi:hypothetical protein Y1Q_0000923 [Alligator mississippiensis]|uniref:Uncharacterized protein n=1 Tax=Alligator mississippiensis TaxID=8496 RepID=A0A151NDX7_ALLMI|nr:hypothetical protein Y1Q_0000923 [Alligator mississippiensis]
MKTSSREKPKTVARWKKQSEEGGRSFSCMSGKGPQAKVWVEDDCWQGPAERERGRREERCRFVPGKGAVHEDGFQRSGIVLFRGRRQPHLTSATAGPGSVVTPIGGKEEGLISEAKGRSVRCPEGQQTSAQQRSIPHGRMDRLRWMLRRRSAKVVSVGAESSREPGQEDLGPTCHDDEGPIKARRWLCPSCCQTKRAAPGTRRNEETKPTTSRTKWRWPWVRLGKQEPAAEHRQAEELRSSPPMSSGNLEPNPAGPQQEAAPCAARDEGPYSLGESCTSPSLSCSSSWDDSHSNLESGTTSPSHGSSLGDSSSSLESRNASPSPNSFSGDSDSSLESQNTSSSSSSSSSSEDTHSSLQSGTTPAPGTSRTGEGGCWGPGGLRAIHSVRLIGRFKICTGGSR